MKRSCEKRQRRRSLFVRIYIYSILLLIAVVITVVSAAKLVKGEDEPPMHQIHLKLAKLLAEKLDQPASAGDLQAFLQDMQRIGGVNLALFAADGSPLATAGEKKLDPLRDDELCTQKEFCHYHASDWARLAIPIREGSAKGGYLLIGWEAGHHPLKFVFVIAAVFLLLLIAPLPLARAISKPLARIGETAQRLGEGELSTRTGISRGDEIGRLARNVDEMAGRLENLIHSEKEMLANISHEIRTPLSRLQVALELLEEEKDGLSEAKQKQFSGMSADVEELERLVEDVLMAARLDLSLDRASEVGFTIKPESLSLLELVESAAGRLAHNHPDCELEVTLPDNLPQIQADPVLIRRMIENLLDNAAKYSELEESGAECLVELQARLIEDRLEVVILDGGAGVPEQELERLFEPFFRSDPSRSRKGLGLGLTLCRRIIDAHGGSIRAMNRKDGGLEVVFELPLG